MMPFGVVNNMNYVFIGDVFKVSSGGTPNRKKPEYFDGGTIPWVKTGELKGKFANKPAEFITQTALENSSAKVFPPKTVLLAMYGATIGACSILDFEAATNQACAAILPTEDCDEVYLYYYLSSIKPTLVSKGVGGAQPNISAGLIKKIKIPLLPLDEQKKIVAILDAADALRQKDAQLIAKYNDLSQSLFLDMFGDPVTNPKGWGNTSLENVCKNIYGGGTPSKSKPEYFIGSIPWVTPKDMKQAYINDSIDHINDVAVNNSSAKLIPVGAVLMVIRSGILKHTLPLAITTGEITINQDMKAFIPCKDKTNSQFLMHYFMAVERFLLGKVRAVTADNIEFRQIKKLPFPAPPITLQNQFAERIQAIEAQKQQAQAALQKSEDLFNSLLQRAFKGELTQ